MRKIIFLLPFIIHAQPTVDSNGWVIPFSNPTSQQKAMLRLVGGYTTNNSIPFIPNGSSPWPWIDITEFGCNTSPNCPPTFHGVMTSLFTAALANPPLLGAALAGTCNFTDGPAICTGVGSNYGVEATVGTCLVLAWNPPGEAAGSGTFHDTVSFQSGQVIAFSTFQTLLPAQNGLTLYKCNNPANYVAWTAFGNVGNTFNYYDPASELIRANWRTAPQDTCGTYCTQARQFLDIWFQWAIDNGRSIGSPRATSLMGLLWRALDAHPNWLGEIYNNFPIAMSNPNAQATVDCNSNAILPVDSQPARKHICDTRENGYIQADLVEMAIADTPANGGVADLVGTVNTSGTAVTWVSGDHFTSVMNPIPGGYGTPGALQYILINNVYYQVLSYNSSTSVTLYTSAGTQTGVNYNFGHHTFFCGAIMANTPGWINIVEPEGFRDLPIFRWNQGFPFQGTSNSVWQMQVYVRSLEMTYDVLTDTNQATGCPNSTLAAQLLPIIQGAFDWSYNAGISKVALGGNGYAYYDANALTYGVTPPGVPGDNNSAIASNGSIAVTNGSTNVVGTGTAFTTPGHGLQGSSNCNGTDWLVSMDFNISFTYKSIYLIDSCADGTHLTLHVPFGTYGEVGNLTSGNSGFYVTPSAATNCASAAPHCNSYGPPPSSIYPPPLTDPNNTLDFTGNVGWLILNCKPQPTCAVKYRGWGEELFARAARGPRDGPYGTQPCQGPGGLCYGGPGPVCDGVGGGGGQGYCQSQFASALDNGGCGYSCGNGPLSALGKAAGQAAGFTKPLSYLAYRLIPIVPLPPYNGKIFVSGNITIR
jgi:hypothetical protein